MGADFWLVLKYQNVLVALLENAVNSIENALVRNGQVVLGFLILQVEPVDEETENYLAVEDEGVLNAVFQIFKEKFQDVLEFEE